VLANSWHGNCMSAMGTGEAPTDFNFSKELSEIKREPVNVPR
jgi:hypothetical protein